MSTWLGSQIEVAHTVCVCKIHNSGPDASSFEQKLSIGFTHKSRFQTTDN